ncbi:MAG: response regulator, partial [Desulfobulbaceae bacterium]|nr:response regulator [Desulfobulbaceae bacterium]
MKKSMYPGFPVMLVDDEVQALDSFEIALRSASMNHFIRCQDSRDVMPILSSQEVEVMLLDLRMPHVSGEALHLLIITDFPEIPVIIITGAN